MKQVVTVRKPSGKVVRQLIVNGVCQGEIIQGHVIPLKEEVAPKEEKEEKSIEVEEVKKAPKAEKAPKKKA